MLLPQHILFGGTASHRCCSVLQCLQFQASKPTQFAVEETKNCSELYVSRASIFTCLYHHWMCLCVCVTNILSIYSVLLALLYCSLCHIFHYFLIFSSSKAHILNSLYHHFLCYVLFHCPANCTIICFAFDILQQLTCWQFLSGLPALFCCQMSSLCEVRLRRKINRGDCFP